MCGSAQEHASRAFLDIDAAERTALQGALEDLLTNQYVCVDGETYHQVMIGAGMGQIASGEVADTTFLELAEVGFAALASVQSRFGIQRYLRYRDDMLIVGDDVNLMREFFEHIKRLVRGIYVVELSEASKSCISFLDVVVYKEVRGSTTKVGWRLFFKPTSQHLPLASDSGHAPTIHRSWPKAEICRLSRRSTSESAFVSAREKLCSKWQASFLNSEIVSVAHSINFSAARGRKPVTRAGPVRSIWLVIPYVPCYFSNVLFERIDFLNKRWHENMSAIVGSSCVLRIAWKNSSRNILDLLRSV